MAGAFSTTASRGQDIRIAASDGFSLAATRFDPADRRDVSHRPVTIISSAAAVRRSYYAAFAAALAEQGAGGTVYTYDYRGIGGSIDGPIKSFETDMRTWGQRDAPGMLHHVAAAHPGRPIHWVGQSYGGGFAVGLNPSNHLISRHLGVAVPHGYFREMDGSARWKVGLLMGVGVPFGVAIAGYLPGKRFGFGEDLPKGAALEWRSWIMSRNSMWDTIPAAELAPYSTFSAPMCFIRLTDDPWASDIGTARIAAAFSSAPEKHIVRLGPGDAGGHAIDHLGFFRSRFAATLWPRAFAWLDGQAP